MRQKGGDVGDAAWQNPPLRGEESTGSRAMRGCHVRKGGMIAHNKVRWKSLLPDARCGVRAVRAKVFSHPEKGPLFHKQTLSICWASGYVLYEPEVSVECHHLCCILFKILRSVGPYIHLAGRLRPSLHIFTCDVLTSLFRTSFPIEL